MVLKRGMSGGLKNIFAAFVFELDIDRNYSEAFVSP